LLRNGFANTPVARQWLNRHVIAATCTHATVEEMFSVRSLLRLYNEDYLTLRESLEMAEEWEVGVKWPLFCEDVSPEVEERPLLEDVT
jgi:hypothetical protein